MKKLMIKESTQTVKAKQLKPGMKTAQGVIKSVVHDYLHGKPGVNVNYSTNGHAISDWFYDDKDVEIFEESMQESIKESMDGVGEFVDALNDLYAEDCANNDDPEFDCEQGSSRFNLFIDDLKELVSEFDRMFDNLTHTLVDKVDSMVEDGYSYKQIITNLIHEAELERSQIQESTSVKESYSGPYTERMFEYMDICDRQGLYDLCISFIKWLGDDELGRFARANDMTTVFEESKQPTTGKLNIKED